jgi:hypothetical protein
VTVLKQAPLRRRLSRWRRAARSNSSRALAICGAFGALTLAGAYAAKEHPPMFQSIDMSGAGGLKGAGSGKAGRPTGFAELGPGDPVTQFPQTHVGQVLIASSRSDTCRRLLFDNRTGTAYEVKGIFCGYKPEEMIEAESPARLNAMSKSFQR